MAGHPKRQPATPDGWDVHGHHEAAGNRAVGIASLTLSTHVPEHHGLRHGQQPIQTVAPGRRCEVLAEWDVNDHLSAAELDVLGCQRVFTGSVSRIHAARCLSNSASSPRKRESRVSSVSSAPWFCFAFILACVTTVHAAERTEAECTHMHPEMTSPVEMAACTSDVAGSQQALDSAYNTLRQRIYASQIPVLETVEKSWLAYRDAQCEYNSGGYAGNTSSTSDIIACKADMNRARANELEGDLKRWP